MIFTTSDSNKQNNNTEIKTGIFPVFDRVKFRKVLKSALVAAGAVIFWFIIWYALSLAVDKEIILPSPISVILKLGDLIKDTDFWVACATSVLRIIIGTVFGCIVGILLAVLMLISKTIRGLIYPFLAAVKATPVASFIIAALFWIDRGSVPAFISFLIVLPMICDAVYTGIKNADVSLIEVARIYRFSFLKRVRYIYVPSAIPFFLSAIRTSVGMAWKSGVAAEVLCTPNDSIGKELYLTKVYMETTDMFAWTLTIIMLSIIFEKITVYLVSKGLKKYSASEDGGNVET